MLPINNPTPYTTSAITKENISSKFGESREQANKIIKLLMVEEFATKTSKQMDFVNKTQEEINTAVKKYNDKQSKS